MITKLQYWPGTVYQLFGRPRVLRFSVVGLLLVQSLMLAHIAYVHSPTYNEPAHLIAGISYWRFGRFDIYKVNPPLVKSIAALPVIASEAKTDWKNFYGGPGARPEFEIGEDFVAANGNNIFWLMTIARWACIPFTLLGGYICYRWGKELYGPLAGVIALTLWTFCPNILAHGALITSDATATSLGLTACYTFWRWLKFPTWWHTLLSGVVLGIAELAKTTLIIFYPLWPLLWIVYRWSERGELAPRQWFREIGMLIGRMAIGLYVINLGYGFEGSGKPLGEFQFVSASLTAQGGTTEDPPVGGNRFANSRYSSLPVLLPANYVLGIDLQKKDFERFKEPSYLRGEFRTPGWWYYYLYALAIKVPLGTWLLLLMAAVVRIFARVDARLRDEFFLLVVAAIILIFVSAQTGLNEHMRYVLPAFPYFYIWIGRIAVVFRAQRPFAATAVCLALAWSLGSSLWYYPHHLSYFNELIGDPKNGPNHLIMSNVDWGQDLLYLKKWQDEHPDAAPVTLAYFGPLDPKYAGIHYRPLKTSEVRFGGVPKRWYAISATLLRGYPFKEFNRKKTDENSLPRTFANMSPAEVVGGSIYLYHF